MTDSNDRPDVDPQRPDPSRRFDSAPDDGHPGQFETRASRREAMQDDDATMEMPSGASSAAAQHESADESTGGRHAAGAGAVPDNGGDGDDGRDHDGLDEFDEEEDEPKRAGCFKVGCLTLLAMMLVTALAAGGFAFYLNWKLNNNIKKSALLPTANSGDPTRNPDKDGALNILLLGSDSRSENLSDASRSDVIQLVHISDDHKKVQVVHFPRDLFVSIPGYGKNKINAAYAYGKVPLLAQTMQDLLGIKIDHAAMIGFDGFAKLTNTVGGVDLYVPQTYSKWNQGYHHMNGDQALEFVRQRYQLKGGDIDRGRNQQAWLKAVMSKTLKTGTLLNPLKLNNIVDDVTSNGNLEVDKDLNVQSLGFSLRNLRMSDVTFYTAPFTGFGNDPVAGSIDIVDEPKMKALGKALYNDDFSTYTGEANNLR